METNETLNNEKQESEASMGFMLATDLLKKVTEIATSMTEDQDLEMIPDSDGQVLVRYGSKAFLERKGDKSIFKIPVRLKTSVGGNEVEETFLVCSK